MSSRNISSLLKRQRELKRGIRFTIMVCGEAGTGKSTFINSLLDTNLSAKASKDSTTKTVSFTAINAAVANAAERQFDPATADQQPGIAVTETKVQVVDDDDSHLLLTVVQAPGFGQNLDNTLCIKEITNYLEQQFDLVLAEETKVRRNPRFQDTRVHVCVYFITPTGHGLRELDVLAMKKISRYANVIPVIGRADSFTKTEIINFKRRINEDIERFKIPVFQFSCDEDEDDADLVQQAHYLQHLQPFAVIGSNDVKTLSDGTTTRVRSYPWGEIDINDTDVSDFAILRSVLLGSHLQDLKDITHDYLYENYRTERLSSVSDLKADFSAEPPSMSNLAAIAKSKSMAEFDGVKAGDTSKVSIASSAKQPVKSMLNPGVPDLLRTNTVKMNKYSLEDDEELKSMTAIPEKPHIKEADTSSITASVNSTQSSVVVDTRRLRKISETVPYMLQHQTLLTKQQKLEELERKSALGLAKRAAELEKKAMILKLKEKRLKEMARNEQ